MRYLGAVIGVVVLCWAGTARAGRDVVIETQALVVIANTANAICYNIDQRGEKTSSILNAASLNGTVLNGAITEVSGLKIEGSGELANEKYQGVMQSELLQALQVTEDCKKKVFDVLVVRMLPAMPADTGLPAAQSVHLKRRTSERPSVDCGNASEPLVELLCADADLALWDGRMGTAYHTRMSELDGDARRALLKSQRDWIKVRYVTCNIPKSGNWTVTEMAPQKPCILRMTKDRVSQLGSN